MKVWGRQDLAETVTVWGGGEGVSCGQLSRYMSSDPGQPGPSGTDCCLTRPLQFVPSRGESESQVYLRFGRVPVTLISLCLHHPDALGLLPDPSLSPRMVLNHRETPTDVWKVLPYCMDRCSQEGRGRGGRVACSCHYLGHGPSPLESLVRAPWHLEGVQNQI